MVEKMQCAEGSWATADCGRDGGDFAAALGGHNEDLSIVGVLCPVHRFTRTGSGLLWVLADRHTRTAPV